MEDTMPKKKVNNKMIVIIMLVAAIVVAGVIVGINIVKNNVNKSDEGNGVTTAQYYTEVSDTITNLVKSADITVRYYTSSQRTAIYFIGYDKYYGLRYDAENKFLYIFEKGYTAGLMPEERKIAEAEANDAGWEKVFDDVTVFTVDNADVNGNFPDGKVTFTLAVDKGSVVRKSFSVNIPEKRVAEEVAE